MKPETIEHIALRSSLVLPAAFLAILCSLHFIEPQFNVGHMISEYQLGDRGWLMSLAFFCLGAASLSLFVALRSTTLVHGGRVGRWGILVVAAAYLVAGIFPPLRPPAIAAYLHGVGGIIVIFGSPVVFTSISRGVGRSDAGPVAARRTRWATATAWLGLLLFAASIPLSPLVSTHPPLAFASIFNRIMIVSYCAWTMVVATHATRMHGARPS